MSTLLAKCFNKLSVAQLVVMTLLVSIIMPSVAASRTDVTAQVEIKASGFRLDRISGKLVQGVRVEVPESLSRLPLYLAVEGIPAQVEIETGDGARLRAQSQSVLVPLRMQETAIDHSNRIMSAILRISNPNNQRLDYSFRVVRMPN